MKTPDVDPAHFRQLLGRFTTGVVVITTRAADGHPMGMTANSLASVSLVPPLVSIAVDKLARIHPVVVAAEHYAFSILSAGQETLSRRFADPHDDRFDGIGYHLSPRQNVLLDGAVAHIECERHAQFDAGDHTILVGRVIAGDVHDGRPLAYFRGGYAALA